jgi:predicted N-acyltransferase
VALTSPIELRVLDRIDAIPAEQWDSLLAADSTPFLRHAFLASLEKHGCVGGSTGWQVAHLAIYPTDSDKPIGLMPLYLKSHSYGEYVFDWSWAEAYAQHGMQYYPKAL